MDLVVAAFLGTEGREPTPEEVMRVYNACRLQQTPKWVGGVQTGYVPVLEMTNHETYEIFVNNPSMVIEEALSYMDNGWRGGLSPDRALLVPQHYPRDFRLTYTVLNFRRPSLDGHWVLACRSGRNIVYDPDESLELDYWSRSPSWRGIRIWRV